MHQKFNKNVSSVGADFRNLAPVLVHDALRQARTVVCEPVETFQLEIPVGALPVVTVTLARLSGLVTGTETDGGAAALTLTGTIPTRNVQPLLSQLPEQTSGEAVFTSEVTPTPRSPDRPRPAPASAPTRWTARPGSVPARARPPAVRRSPVLPAGVAISSTVVRALLCSPKTEAAASVSDAMSRRISSSASGRANIASRTPSESAGEAVWRVGRRRPSARPVPRRAAR